MRLVIDLETDGLLQNVTKIHCISVIDLDSTYSELFVGNHKIIECFEKLKQAKELIGHNIFNYDLKVIEKLFNIDFTKSHQIKDTFILGQLLFSDLKNEENSPIFPGKIFSKQDTGRHSLKAWGQRIKCYKGEYKGTWEEYNDDMGRYCIQDTYTTKALFTFFSKITPLKLLNDEPINLEYSIAPIIARQQNYGVLYDKDKSDKFIVDLTSNLVEANWKLQTIFKPRFISLGEFVPAKNNKNKGYMAGAVFTKIKLEEFNPGSRTQIVNRLIKEFNWNPEEFTEKGNVKMNEDIIENLPFKELQPLKEYLTIKKRLSQIESGTQAWNKNIGKDGRIRGSIRQNGAVTGRMAHFSPNMGQVPSNDSLYGKECRELFIVPSDRIMIGCDADALEMRCLAGYLKPLDKGRFMESLLHGNKETQTDPHSINAEAMGISRDAAKTVFYAMIYGARNAKIGKILLEHGIDFNIYVDNFKANVDGIIKWVNDKKKKAAEENTDKTRMYWECWVAGKECLTRFGDRIPELPMLIKKVTDRIKEVGYIRGLDGRKLFCRSEHGALNTVLQSAGALIMKKALAIADNELQNQELKPGIDYEFILNVHDEWQLEVNNDKKTIDIVCGILENSIKKAGEFFNFPCSMKGNTDIGHNWSETH